MYKIFLSLVLCFFINISCFAQQGINLNPNDKKSAEQLSKAIMIYPSQVHFFENPGIQSVLKKILPEQELKLIKTFEVESPIQVRHALDNSKNISFLVNNCLPHDCNNNNLSTYLSRNDNGSYVLIAYFRETNAQGTQGKWFTPVQSCNITKDEPKYSVMEENQWLTGLKERLQCLQSHN